MDRHLVSVKVGVKCEANQGMQLNRFSFYEQRIECLNAETVKGRGPVEHDELVPHHLFQNGPYFIDFLFDKAGSSPYVIRKFAL